jgi:hypothetical protein
MARCYCGSSQLDPEDVDLVRDGTPICTRTCLDFYDRDHRPQPDQITHPPLNHYQFNGA